METVRLEEIGGGLRVEVSDDHGFGEDALLLAQFAAPRSMDIVCDLGTGCGIIPLLWCRRKPAPQIYAVEIQPAAAAMARGSVSRAGLDHAITVFQADLREWRTFLKPASQDVVTMNPPYFASGSGGVSGSAAARIARHEGAGCTLSDVVQTAYGLLRDGGRFCLCHRPERLCDVLMSLRTAGLEPKRLRFVHADRSAKPWLFLCEARKGGARGLSVLPPFFSKGEDGNDAKEKLELYNMYL